MQSVSSRIRTRVAVSISYDDNHYTTPYYVMVIEPVSDGIANVAISILIGNLIIMILHQNKLVSINI